MYKALKGCYWWLERTVIRLLPDRLQWWFRSHALGVANRLFPQRVIARNVQELQALAEAQSHEWVPPRLPEWVFQELEEISSEIDPDLHPKGEFVSTAEFYSAPWTYSLPGDRYYSIRGQMLGKWDVVIFVPWLKNGGADLGAIHFANTLSGDLNKRVVVIATENSDSPWAGRLLPNVNFIGAGVFLADLHESHRNEILVRLMLQVAPSTIHVMNSLSAWEMIKRNGLAIRQQSKIYASLYCDDVTKNGQRVGYAQKYLAICHQVLDGVISDNPVTPSQWCKQIGINPNLFHVVRFPAPNKISSRVLSAGSMASVHVLWAGRLDRQKRPDLLSAIAKRMPDVTFDVYGQSVISEVSYSDVENIKNIVMHGRYDNFVDILGAAPSAYLYTSEWDGLPNVLLEAASAGLPIVASDVGGIADFLASEQLVHPFDDVECYVEKLRRLMAEPLLVAEWKERQFARIEHAHSKLGFIAGIGSIPGYLKPVPENAGGVRADIDCTNEAADNVLPADCDIQSPLAGGARR